MPVELFRISAKGNRQRKYGKTWKTVCRHDRIRSQCAKCGGGGICEHKIQRSRCAKCGGGEICEHKIRRSRCAKCCPDRYLCARVGDVHLGERVLGRYRDPAGQRLCYNCLGALHPHLVTLKVRQEHLVLAELQRRIPELEQFFVTWDCPVPGGCSLKRPDMLWELPAFYVQLEVDEGGKAHEDSRDRLEEIRQSMGTHRPGLVLRVNPDGMLKKRQHGRDLELKYTAARQFDAKMDKVEAVLRQAMADAGQDLMRWPYPEEDLHVIKLFF